MMNWTIIGVAIFGIAFALLKFFNPELFHRLIAL